MKNFSPIITSLLILLLQGCNYQEKVSWNTGNTCELPCWNDVNVGSTTKPEFIQIINRLSIIDQDKNYIDGENWKFFSGTSRFSFKDTEIQIEAYYLGEKIVNLAFSGDLRTTLGDMVALLGEPDYIITTPRVLPTVMYSVTAVFPSSGIAYVCFLSTRWGTEITPDIPIDYIQIFDPMIYDELINASLFGGGSLSEEEIRESTNPWDGYGSLLEKYPPAWWKLDDY